MTTQPRVTFCRLSFLLTVKIVAMLIIVAVLSGCGPHYKKSPVQVWRIRRCARNGDAFVCQCDHYYDKVDAKTGEVIRMCD